MNESSKAKKLQKDPVISKYAAKKLQAASYIEANGNSNKPNEEDGHATEEVKTAKHTKIKGLPAVTSNFPEHVVYLALLIKNNAEIRRFTALGILNYLSQRGIIPEGKKYVSFKWNKFAVSVNGLVREYSYTEQFFLTALVASFSSFSASAQRTIDTFCNNEMGLNITKSVDKEDVDQIIDLNEKYQNTSEEYNQQ